jgi:hypothetical protein
LFLVLETWSPSSAVPSTTSAKLVLLLKLNSPF